MKEYQKQKINAAVQEDIEAILKNKGLWEPLQNQLIKCLICGEVITPDSIGALIIRNDSIYICCDNLDCLEQIGK